jgi:hypothetical protein
VGCAPVRAIAQPGQSMGETLRHRGAESEMPNDQPHKPTDRADREQLARGFAALCGALRRFAALCIALPRPRDGNVQNEPNLQPPILAVSRSRALQCAAARAEVKMQNEPNCQSDRCLGRLTSPPRSRRVLAASSPVRRHEHVAAKHENARPTHQRHRMQRFAAKCSALRRNAALCGASGRQCKTKPM